MVAAPRSAKGRALTALAELTPGSVLRLARACRKKATTLASSEYFAAGRQRASSIGSGVEAGIDGLHPQEAPDHQPRADQQHEREPDLGDDEGVAQPPAARAARVPRLDSFRDSLS